LVTDNTAHWAGQLQDAWGIEGELHPLPGEFDLNFRVAARNGRRFVLKVMRVPADEEFVELLCTAHAHIRSHDASVPVPDLVPLPSGALWCTRPDPNGRLRYPWLLSALPGQEYATYRPHALPLIQELGGCVARLDRALTGFEHPQLHRDMKWDMRRAEWIDAHLDPIHDPGRRAVLSGVIARHAQILPALRRQPLAPIHNDVNDYNILVTSGDSGSPRVTGILDLGDLIEGPIVAEVAITAAYVALDHPQPERAIAALVSGYHAETPLSAEQLDLIWPLLLTRLAVSVVNSALVRRERPGDPYVVISEAPAWRFLERSTGISEARMTASLRAACGLPATDEAGRVLSWLDASRGTFAPVLEADLASSPVVSLALADTALPRDLNLMTAAEALALGPIVHGTEAWIGRYGEPRGVYTDTAFRASPYRGSPRRTVHLGIDIFMEVGTPVHTPHDAVVESVEDRTAHLDYGGMVVLRHATAEGDEFTTLYGHLAPDSTGHLTPGQRLKRGAKIADLGGPSDNGGWQPHLHFQLVVAPEAMPATWPGVADPDDRDLWQAICPNPAALLNLADDRVAFSPLDVNELRETREGHFAGNLRLSYDQPCLFVRGWRTHLYDQWGRPHLDAYNNVPHVGHAHPRIAAVAHDQLSRLNTNTRYLHPAQITFAETLLAKLPRHLTHVFLVNSGSEANELALRLARAHTGARDMVVVDHGYHGNTTGAIDLSAYKFNTPGGGGAPDWVHLVPVPDTYRGEHRGEDAAGRYAGGVDDALQRLRARGGRVAGFIAETFPSVAGQIIPPAGYLQAVYARIRAAGGVCIADEVQTGLGRLGVNYWGFEQQQADPDIVVLGKPLGNGHPIGAVVTTAAIARSFDNGIEFFSTFGGSSLSCGIGTAVLRIVDEEGLQANAVATGARLLGGLRDLASRHAVIGDVRGAGLFVGVDLVTDRATREPATRAAHYIANRMRQERILIGTEGPADNVLKIRPPLTVDADDIAHLLETLDRVLAEAPVSSMVRP
jgi:4-aminobutyrate aminotransferase-like enzyme/Ser/Thr protein kinase RdoA (MazF antagonist)